MVQTLVFFVVSFVEYTMKNRNLNETQIISTNQSSMYR